MPKSPEEAWYNIAHFIDILEEKFPESQYKIKFLSDNASFDIASIDYALNLYTGRKPMRYSSSGRYRTILAADDMYDMLSEDRKKEADLELQKYAVHDHDCINDAKHIYWQYILAMKYKN